MGSSTLKCRNCKKYIVTQDQCHNKTFVQGHWLFFFTLQIYIFLKPKGPGIVWTRFGMGEQNIDQPDQVTWHRWLSCPYMTKTFKTNLLYKQKADDLETWHVALGKQVVQMMNLCWTWLIHYTFLVLWNFFQDH